jgi:hypothetical protein
MHPAHRWAALFFSAGMLLLVCSPALRDPPRDSFPLSDYPMFSHGRPDPFMTLTHAVGITPDGRAVPLPPLVAADNREVLQAMMTISSSVHGGRGAVFCEEVAARVRASDDTDLADVTAVAIVTSRYDAIAYFETGPEPLSRQVHVRCAVPR